MGAAYLVPHARAPFAEVLLDATVDHAIGCY